MDVIQNKEKLTLKNIDFLTGDSICKNNSKHGKLLPNNVRCIITGPSEAGKTNLVLNLITHPKGLYFNNIYLFSKSLNQPKYELLKRILSNVPEVNYFTYNDCSQIVHPEKVKPYSVFIFDDISTEHHKIIQMFYSIGRHYNVDTIYIGQTYSKIPKQLIRDNVNLLAIFRQNDANLKHIFSDHIYDCSFTKFKEMCSIAWSKPFGFLVINKEDSTNNGRYRVGFDQFIVFT